MKLVKKTASFVLAMSMVFSGVYANAETTQEKKQNPSEKISQNAKIIGGISAAGLAVAGLIGGGIWCFQSQALPVLIIGGDKNIRKTLIDKLNDPKPMNNNPKEKNSLASYVAKKTAWGANGVEGVGEQRAKFKNWKIRECDENDPNAEKMVNDARLIITILTNEESVEKINKLIAKPKLSNHMVVSIIDENYPSVHSYGENGEEYFFSTLADEFAKFPNYRNFENILIPTNRDGKNSLLLNLGFYWNRKDNTFVCFRWST
ncbi:MAG: hypothetical protein IJI84_00645 [Clostridia bacterium]|nr:hypothetical protein [Clostridia bacterium]